MRKLCEVACQCTKKILKCSKFLPRIIFVPLAWTRLEHCATYSQTLWALCNQFANTASSAYQKFWTFQNFLCALARNLAQFTHTSQQFNLAFTLVSFVFLARIATANCVAVSGDKFHASVNLALYFLCVAHYVSGSNSSTIWQYVSPIHTANTTVFEAMRHCCHWVITALLTL